MKTAVILIATAALVFIFVAPIRDGVNNLIFKNKNKIGEENAMWDAYNNSSRVKGARLSKDFEPETSEYDKKIEIQDKIMNYRLKSRERIKQIQIALKKAGFYKGEIDGLVGPETKKATKVFQKSKGLYPDGIVGARTWEELKEYLTF